MVDSQTGIMEVTKVLANLPLIEMASQQPLLPCIKLLAILQSPREDPELKLQLGSDLFLSMNATKDMKPKNLEFKEQTRLCMIICCSYYFSIANEEAGATR